MVRHEIDRLKQLRETQHEHLAVELLVVISQQTSDEAILGSSVEP